MFNYKSVCYEKWDKIEDKVEFPRDNGYY